MGNSQAERQEKYADPLIDEVRAIRRAISEAYDNDVWKLGDHLKEVEKAWQEHTKQGKGLDTFVCPR